MHEEKQKLSSLPGRYVKYLKYFVKWLVLGSLVGVIGGLVGSAFYLLIAFVSGIREAHSWIIWLLPAAGALIGVSYAAAKVPLDTNRVISAVHRRENIPLIMAPLIFFSTIVTQMFGGSAGREGAALQIGGTIGYNVGKLFRLDERDTQLIVCCGMASVFSALFGLPVTAALFALEIASVGIMMYSGLIPCILSSVIAKAIAGCFDISPVVFETSIPALSFASAGTSALVGIICALVSIVFCLALHGTEDLAKKYVKAAWLRPVIGGALVAVLTFAVGTYDYNGAGGAVIAAAVGGTVRPEAFLLKMIFTILTMALGFKGGEIVPSMFVGATLGCAVGTLIGFEPGFCGAIGLLALLCGMINCPLTIIIMGVEMFGAQGLIFYAIAAAISFTMSGTYGLYREQSLVYSKLRPMYINIHTKT